MREEYKKAAALGVIVTLLTWLLTDSKQKTPKNKKRKLQMAKNNRIFISFAMEDVTYRDFLVGQARNEKSPFSFVDMSVKSPWDSQWKDNCRTKIKGCDGVIVLVSKNTAQATGQLWEIECAKGERIPVRGIYIKPTDRPIYLPTEFSGVRVVDWTWSNIAAFVNAL